MRSIQRKQFRLFESTAVLLSGLVVIVVTIGCSSTLRDTIVTVDTDHSGNLDEIHSFGLIPTTWSDTVGFSNLGVLQEIRWALESEGFIYDEEHPDFYCSAALTIIPSLKYAAFSHGDPIPYGPGGIRLALQVSITAEKLSIVGADSTIVVFWKGTGKRKWRHRELSVNIQYLASDIIEYFPHPKSKLGKKPRE